MSCVFEDFSIDFDCLRQIISRAYQGQLDVQLARMTLKQLDAGLALYGIPDDVTTLNLETTSAEDVASKLEEYVPDEGEVSLAAPDYMQIILLLLELLKLIRKG